MMKNLLISGLMVALIACASGHHEPFKETPAPVRDISGVQ
jgi:hypothetical protein